MEINKISPNDHANYLYDLRRLEAIKLQVKESDKKFLQMLFDSYYKHVQTYIKNETKSEPIWEG